MNTSLFSNTPAVTVPDNRGLTVRNIAYHGHPDTPDVISELITRNQYDARRFLTQSADTRLHDAGLANFTYLTGLSASILRTQGADSGTTVALNDAAGRPFIAVSNIRTPDSGKDDRSQAVTLTRHYEDADLPGRPVSVTQQVTGEAARITARFVYAGNTDAEKALNLAGACVSHYDTAGMVQTGSAALTGMPLSVTRRLLKDADNPDVMTDWQGAHAPAWNDQLGGEAYTTRTAADATGAVLTTTDARGNLQRVAYDVAGLLSGSWLTAKGGREQVIVASLTYSAAGQKLREAHGNGVVTWYAYDARTQRLSGIKTARPAGHAAGAKGLQDLRYAYDPVGNVLNMTDDAEGTRFWRNQKVVPENTYAYDSLYRLVRATGREMAGAGLQGSSLTSATVPLPTDGSAYTSYTRHYTYDEAGNLTQIRHRAPATSSGYTTNITVSDKSNRGVLSTLTESAADVDALFTAGGQQTRLQPGQSLVWTPRNELLKVTPVVRDGVTEDRESYRYDGNSQRLLKVSVQKTGSSTQVQRALYLPGLELRTTEAGSTETESLQVITVGEAGRAQVRALHWESGKPPDISNGQVRYSYDNLTGSSGLELDGDGNVISMEEYYPYGGTAVWTARSAVEADYKTVRYSGKERDATGLYYYGYRYYQPWAGRWLSSDPAGTVDGLNLFRMVRNNPIIFRDVDGMYPEIAHYIWLGNAEIPANAISNMIHFKSNNPSYKVNLWSDSPDKLKNNLIERGYSKELLNKISIQTPPELPHVLSSAIARESRNTPYANYAAASDLMRLAVLKKAGGGIYMDVDVMLKSSLGKITSQRVSSTGPSDLLIHYELWQRNPRVSNAVIVASENSASLDRMISYATAPYNGKLYDMGIGRAAGKDWLSKKLQSSPYNRVSVDDVMWRLKRFIPMVRREITMFVSGPGMIDSWVQASGLSARLQPSKFLASPEIFGQRASGALGGWSRGMNGDGNWASLSGKRRASL
ncbi:RHS repeat-associated core domain-containing protein [Pantoea agglomerans]|uniref:RHS repeat-associated core domain-containing protein n=1 Tax=Enterobacter agglomerans TaxID=549 RepID=UPI0013CD2F27|nr:RHS repeat-associated core domain-containing protein [Pantoea agglomerans]NEG84760.1 RHS repeat protein [Pantoea agglomerans]